MKNDKEGGDDGIRFFAMIWSRWKKRRIDEWVDR